VIAEAKLADAPHKQIADFLHRECGQSYWWAQEVTVSYEKRVGRRVLGQTQDGRFQIGVSKTIPASAETVWSYLESDAGREALFSGAGGGFAELAELDGTTPEGAHVQTTTYVPSSHIRMRWQSPDWDSPSILQIRVTAKSDSKCTVSFHQEKLPSQVAREAMRDRWGATCATLAAAFR
jgi:uncharacterized protein YndB with AHSA1/START domain